MHGSKAWKITRLVMVSGWFAGGFFTSPSTALAIDLMEHCRTLDALTFEPISGKETFDVTSKCVFNNEMHNVRIRILSETFQKILDDACADVDSGYGHVLEFVFDDKKIENVGVKVRGNTSRCNLKRQFTFKFDATKTFSVWQRQLEQKNFPNNEGRTFYGLKNLNVRASANDPSMIREKISSHIFSQGQTKGPLVYRVAFTKFFVSYNRTVAEGPEGNFHHSIDGFYYDYKGLYSLAENIDKTFVNTRFQNGNSELTGFYLFQADQALAHFDLHHYTRKGWSIMYADGQKADSEELLTKAESKLFQLFDALKSQPSDEIFSDLVDMDNIVNYTASSILAGHWDSMLANRNNDFLFFNPTINKWQIIAWDLDNTLGAGYDQYVTHMQESIFYPARHNSGLLFTEIFSERHPKFRNALKSRLQSSISGPLSTTSFRRLTNTSKILIHDNVEPWEGFQEKSYEEIKNFMQKKRQVIQAQIH